MVNRFIRYVVLLVLMLASLSVSAASQVWYAVLGNVAGNGATAEKAIEQVCSYIHLQGQFTGTQGTITDPDLKRFTCPDSGAAIGSYRLKTDCPAGQVPDPDTGECKSPTCKAGDTSTATYYDGRFSISSTAPSDLGGGSFLDLYCDGTCEGPSAGEGDIGCESDAQASPESPKPVSCTIKITLNGNTCSGDSNAPPIYVPSAGTGGDTTCSNGATNFPECTGKCANGSTNYPTCTTTGGTSPGGSSLQKGECNNGATNYPSCTRSNSKCLNGAINFPNCDVIPEGQEGGNGQGGTAVLDCGTDGKPACSVTVEGPSSLDGPGVEPSWYTNAKNTLEDGLKAVEDGVHSGSYNSEASDGQSTVASKLLDWFDPIPQSGCVPYQISVGTFMYTWNHCEVAGRISEIAGYALWIYLLVGSFNQVTGKKES